MSIDNAINIVELNIMSLKMITNNLGKPFDDNTLILSNEENKKQNMIIAAQNALIAMTNALSSLYIAKSATLIAQIANNN